MAHASRELGVPLTEFRKNKFQPYILQTMQALKPSDQLRCLSYNSLFMDEHFCNQPIFSDEANFHLSGKVNCHNVQI